MKKQIFLLASLVSAFAFAGPAKAPQKNFFDKVNEWPTTPEKWTSETPWADFKAIELAKADKSQSRSVATEGKDQAWYESKMSPEFKEARKEFLAVTTPEQLDVMLIKLDKGFDKFPTDLKFFAAQVIPLKAMRGVIWKMIPAVKNTKMLHSVLVTQVKQWAVSQKIYLPTEQWDAGFRYVSEPYLENGALARQFNDESDVQGFLGSVVYPSLSNASIRIHDLNMDSNEIVWDNQLLYGHASFTDAIDRYRLMGAVEKRAVQSNMSGTLSQIAMNRAYSMENSFKMNSEIGRAYGFDSFLNQVDGVPAAKTVKIVRRPEFTNWGVLYPDGNHWMTLSYNNLKDSVIYGQLMVQEMSKRPAHEEYFTDTSSVGPYMRPIKNRLENLVAMVQGKKELHSALVKNDTVVVDVPAFFKNPPHDLKNFYGVKFNEEQEMKSFLVGGRPATQYRNYQHGKPVKWNLQAYQPYFPEVKSDEDLIKAARVLSQSWGGFGVLPPLATYIQ